MITTPWPLLARTSMLLWMPALIAGLRGHPEHAMVSLLLGTYSVVNHLKPFGTGWVSTGVAHADRVLAIVVTTAYTLSSVVHACGTCTLEAFAFASDVDPPHGCPTWALAALGGCTSTLMYLVRGRLSIATGVSERSLHALIHVIGAAGWACHVTVV